MSESEFIEKLKKFCKSNKFEFKGRIQFRNATLLVFIFGNDCIKPFDAWLNQNTEKHSTPTLFDDAIGSYVTLLN